MHFAPGIVWYRVGRRRVVPGGHGGVTGPGAWSSVRHTKPRRHGSWRPRVDLLSCPSFFHAEALPKYRMLASDRPVQRRGESDRLSLFHLLCKFLKVTWLASLSEVPQAPEQPLVLSHAPRTAGPIAGSTVQSGTRPALGLWGPCAHGHARQLPSPAGSCLRVALFLFLCLRAKPSREDEEGFLG